MGREKKPLVNCPAVSGLLTILPYRLIFLFMKMLKPLGTVLCVYEGMRLIFLVGAFMVLQPAGEAAFPWLTLVTPGALFLLMALFWRLNISRYLVYGQLYLAGKGLGVLTTVCWFIFTKSDIIKELLFGGTAPFIAPGIVIFLLLGDLFSIGAAIAAIYTR